VPETTALQWHCAFTLGGYETGAVEGQREPWDGLDGNLHEIRAYTSVFAMNLDENLNARRSIPGLFMSPCLRALYSNIQGAGVSPMLAQRAAVKRCCADFQLLAELLDGDPCSQIHFCCTQLRNDLLWTVPLLLHESPFCPRGLLELS